MWAPHAFLRLCSVFSFGRLMERARLKEPRKVARPRKYQGEAFRGWPVRLDTTHGQPRAHRGELTELGIRLRRSWGEMAKRTGRCVSLSLRDGERAN